MRTLPYSILDVFAEHPLQGNPLAVFHAASSLTTAQMQALARETNLAETTFILPAHDESSGVRVRIFTTREELPFAGHPTLGTASWIYWNHPQLRNSASITLALNAGPITVRFTPPSSGEQGIRGQMRQHDPVFGNTHDPATLAPLLGLSLEDLLPGHTPQTVSTGLPFCIVPLRTLEAAQRLQVAQREAQQYLASSDARFFYCVAPAAASALPGAPHFHARMQFYGGEDPATGSASGCCIAYLVQHGLAPSATPVLIEQGIEILRPSLLTVQATLHTGQIRDVLVAGRTIPVASGSFFLP